MCHVIDTDISTLWANTDFAELVEEYAQESSIKGLPHPNAKREMYLELESAGILRVFSAHDDAGQLIGFFALVLPVIPHYTEIVGTTESFFVGSAFRKTGAGLKLLRHAEQACRDAGARGLLVSAPTGGRLAEVMPKLGYEQSNVVFFRGLE